MRKIACCLLLCLVLAGCRPVGPSRGCGKTEFLMDTVCTVRSDSAAAVDAAVETLQAVQTATDFYAGDSTVARFNRASAGEAVPLDSHTEAILAVALAVAEASDGAFDITIAPVRELWPFHGEDEAAPPSKEAIAMRLELVDWHGLVWDSAAHTLCKSRDGIKIDLGGAAKGYAADAAMDAMQACGAEYGLLNLGGNVAAFGENPDRADGVWQVGIQLPNREAGAYRDIVCLEGRGSVVTAGTYQRQFTYEGRTYHHILNPSDGYPADSGVVSATVTADSSLLADCLSTACLVLGRERGDALAAAMNTTVLWMEQE